MSMTSAAIYGRGLEQAYALVLVRVSMALLGPRQVESVLRRVTR